MKIKFGYLVSLLFLVVFTVTLLNLGSIRENLDEHIEPRVMIRGKCPEGCDYSNMTDRTGKKIESCSRRDGTKCNLLDKCLPGDVEKDGMCQYCEPGLKVVAGKCVPIDTNASLPVMSRAPCKDGEKSINEICLKCPAGKKLDNNSLCRVDSTVAPVESRNAGTKVAATSVKPPPQGVPSCDIEKFAAY